MNENPLDRRFAMIADHLESLATSIQDVEELQVQDRGRMDRLERLFKLMIRIGDRERKELRERINALIDAQMRSEDKMESLREQMQELSAAQTRSTEAATVFQAQVGVALSKLADATAQAYRRLDALESSENG